MEIGLHENQMRVYKSKARFICLNCLPPGSLVAGKEYKPIEDISIGDSVLGSCGQPNLVLKTFKRKFDGELYTIDAMYNLPVEVTGEHPVRISKVDRNENFAAFKAGRRPHKIVNTVLWEKWINAQDIQAEVDACASTERLYMHMVRTADCEGVTFWKLPEISNRSKYTQTEFPINAESAFFLGWYLAKGFVTKQRGYAGIGYSLGLHEVEQADRICDFYNKLGYRVVPIVNGTILRVNISSTALGELFEEKFGRLSHNIRVPYEIGHHPDKKIVISFLKGYFEGNGHYNKSGKRLQFKTASESLATTLQAVFVSLGYCASVSKHSRKPCEIEGREVTGRDFYVIEVSDSEIVAILSGIDVEKASRRYGLVYDTHILVPIQSIKKRHYDGFVYNLHTEDNTFLNRAMLLHNCGRRFGKSWFGAAKVIIAALAKPNGVYWILAPTFPQTGIMWRMVQKLLPKKYIKRIYLGEMYIELTNGATIWAKSADKYDNLRGEGLDGVVLDEAAMIHPDAWFKVVRPALMDKMGWALFCTTPRGKNWYYKLYNRGVKGHISYKENWESFTFSSYDNPFLDRGELNEIVDDLSELEFEQEILAIFLSDGGTVFKNIDACTRSHISSVYIPGRTYVMGVDLGRHQDFTVIDVCDTETKELIYTERFNKTAWSYIKSRIKSVYKRYGHPPVFLDTTGVGDAIQEDLEADGVNVVSYKFTLESKRELVKRLSVAFSNCDIFIPEDISLREELESFTYVQTDAGNIKYGAPKGYFDDQVCALMLANYGMNGGVALCIGGFETELTQEEYDDTFERTRAKRFGTFDHPGELILNDDYSDGCVHNWTYDDIGGDPYSGDVDDILSDSYSEDGWAPKIKRGGYIEI